MKKIRFIGKIQNKVSSAKNFFKFIKENSNSIIKKSNSGMTLIEVITALAIFILLMTSVAMLFEPSYRVYEESTNLSRTNLIFDNVLDRLEDEIAYATQFTVTEEWAAGSSSVSGIKQMDYENPTYGTMRLSQNDLGELQITQILSPNSTDSPGTVMFGKDFYMGNKIQLGIVPQYPPGENKTTVVCIQLSLHDRYGKLMGTREKYVTLFNTSFIK